MRGREKFPHLVGLSLCQGCVECQPQKIQKSSLDGPTFGRVMEEFFQTCDREELRLFVGIARRLWQRINEFVHGGPFLHPNALVQQAKDALLDYSAANCRVVESHPNFEEPDGGRGVR